MMMMRMMMKLITCLRTDDSQVDPEFRPTRDELRRADEEGDS